MGLLEQMYHSICVFVSYVRNFQGVLLWELPAVEEISRDYLEQVQFSRYQAIIVCSAERLSEWDVWLAMEAEKRHIPCYILRTKIDRDIESDKDDYGDTHDERK